MKSQFSNAIIGRSLFPALLALLFLTAAAGAQPTNFARSLSGLRTQLDAHLNQPRFSGAMWGVKIASLDTGRVIFESHPDRLMSPASNSKLYAGALALDEVTKG